MYGIFPGPSELSVIERCPYYRGVYKERFDCTERFAAYFIDLLFNKNIYFFLSQDEMGAMV